MIRLSFKKIFVFTAISACFILPTLTFAQVVNPPDVSFKIEIPPPLKGGVSTIPALLELIISSVILPIGGVVVVIMIIYAGFLYVTARGNPTKIETAHKALLYAAIGAAVLLGARVLAGAIQATVTQLQV